MVGTGVGAEQRETEDAARLEALRKAARAGAQAFERHEYRSFASCDAMERHLIDITDRAIDEETA